MPLKIEYITDIKGKRISVIIPFSQWKHLESDYNKLKNKAKVLAGLQNALDEVKQSQIGMKKGRSLKSILDKL